MTTRSLRARVTITTLAVLAVVLAAVVTAVTLTYRARLEGNLRSHLRTAAAAVQRAGSPPEIKQLASGLALEGIDVGFSPAPSDSGVRATARSKISAPIRTHGSLLRVAVTLSGGIRVSLTASVADLDRSITSLLLVELLVAITAFAAAAVLVMRGTRTALRPLSTVIETASRIAHGDLSLRLEPSRTDTELGRLASTFDQMLDSLETAIREARASDAATRRFLADASHELRTPIAALQATIETLLREQPERPERDRLEAAAATESERLGRMIDDLLGLARLEARPNLIATDLAEITRELVDYARLRAPRATIAYSADANTTVPGDPVALETIVRNLIDNALAATTPQGQITLQLRRANGYVRVHIADDGSGIPEEQRQRIFERFVRLDPTKPGHGLGLAIARRIARQHDGDLTCDLTASGASFTLSLPAACQGESVPGRVFTASTDTAASLQRPAV
jgi:two-component system OmpR family sensor kinase